MPQSKQTERPIGIDLFAGAGGFSLGFEQAGFDIAAAVEIDPIHAAVHHFNFPESATIANSVVGLSAERIRRLANIENKKIDVVFGGAPCQGFSLIGKRVLDDPRNSLVREFVRIVVELEANYFVFENVKGLTTGKHQAFLTELIKTFDNNGYDVRLPWRVLNASHYGVPQNRERLFLLGAKKGLPLPDYPEQITEPAGAKQLSLIPSGPTCLEALGDLPEAEDYEELVLSDSVKTENWGTPSEYARIMRCLDDESWFLGYKRKISPLVLTSSMRTNHTAISRRRFEETQPGTVEPISRFFRLPSNGLSNTLRAGTDSARGAFTSPRPIHYSSPRCITVREMARLHGFPDWFRLHKRKWHGARQIGNAVPPPVVRSIATKIIESIGISIEKPRKTLSLGNSYLLDLDLTQASSYWGIEKPIKRRDRKSGNKKRKQEEIEAIRLQEIND